MRGQPVSTVIPRWYQDLSIPQMDNVLALGSILRADYAEQATGRTQCALKAIGVTSTFVKITAEQIRKLRRLTDLDPTKFLSEIYRSITGESFIREGYKQFYDCNERIILSAIAFLTFPEAVVELHKRIPIRETPKFPPKRKKAYTLLENISPRKGAKSPYLDRQFTRPDWLMDRNKIDIWRQQCQKIATPRLILPPVFQPSQIHDVSSIEATEKTSGENEKKDESYQQEKRADATKDNHSVLGENIFYKVREKIPKSKRIENIPTSSEYRIKPKSTEKRILKNQSDSWADRYLFDFKLSNILDKKYQKDSGKSHENVSDYAEREFSEIAWSWLDEKNVQPIIAGLAVNDGLPRFPISLESNGLASITPKISAENFLAALNLDDSIGKTYPHGRENLSRKWQEWLQDVDEEYMKVEKEADKILKSVQHTLKLLDVKDACCACRQTGKHNEAYKKTKKPHIVIETLAPDKKYRIGALAMISPAPSLSESTPANPEIIVPQYKIMNSRVISGVINDTGRITYCVSGVKKYVEHIPQESVMSKAMLTINSFQNVPPCDCSVGKTINEGLSKISNDDNIPRIKNQRLCVGNKYGPPASGISGCQNPFTKSVDDRMTTAGKEKKTYPLPHRTMDTAVRQPRRDENGMVVVGGTRNDGKILDVEELSRRAVEGKIILEKSPSGGRSANQEPVAAPNPAPETLNRNFDSHDDDRNAQKEVVNEKEIEERVAKKNTTNSKVDEIFNRPAIQEEQSRNTVETLSKRNRMRGVEGKTPRGGGVRGSKNKYDSKARTQSKREKVPSLQNLDRKIKGIFRVKSTAKRDVAKMTEKQRLRQIKNRWNKIKRLMNKFVQPPPLTMEKQAKMCKKEVGCVNEEGEEPTKDTSPFGWRTNSEQRLTAQNTLVYLVEPDKPVEKILVRTGGKPCNCRENRNAKKILLYGVCAITEEGGKSKPAKKCTRVIDGLTYITPTPSLRNSEEYIPEYELYDLPYEKCVREGKNNNLQYIKRYSGPKSLTVQLKPRDPCNCSTVGKDSKHAFHDEGLIDFYSRYPDNVPCWQKCAEFSRDRCCSYPRILQVKKPVCECNYDRKIVKREEEKENWLRRQARLKNHKIVPYHHIAGISRLMQMETDIVISGIRETSRDNDKLGGIGYCVNSIAQNFVMGPADRVLSKIGMHTPVRTPDEPSKEEITTVKTHRHWSQTDIYGRPAFSTNREEAFSMRDIDPKNPNNDHRQEVGKMRLAAEYSKSIVFNSIKDHGLSRLENSKSFPKRAKKVKQKELSLVASATIQRNGQSPAIHSLTTTLGGIDKKQGHKHKSTKHVPYNYDDGMTLDLHDKTYEISPKTDNIKELLKVELEKMASEGFLFAQLPVCWHFPQLQYWLMYRQRTSFPLEEKKKIMEQSIALWNSVEKQSPKKIRAPLFQVAEEMIDNCNYDEAYTIKHEVISKKETFLSEIRKLRVLQARNMWGLMEFGKFPGIPFKKTFFTYQASKESDGFLFKPWENK